LHPLRRPGAYCLLNQAKPMTNKLSLHAAR